MAQEEQTARQRADRHAYYQAHRGEVLARRRAYRLAHPDRVHSQQRAYRQSHHDEYLEYQRQYYLKVLKARREAQQKGT